MNSRADISAIRSWLFVLALSVTAPAWTAEDMELGEVVVEGRRSQEEPAKRPSWEDLQKPFDWLARLVGRFVVDGHVDLHATGKTEDLLRVQGRVECVGFGIAPGVQCELKIRWPETKGPNGEEIPGGVPNLNPAAMLFGYEPLHSGIHYIVIDSQGVADSAIGLYIAEDTVQSRSPCVATTGNCERLVRIVARPDLKKVDMRIDLEVDQQKTVSYHFVLNRVPGSPSVVFGRKEKK